MFVKIGAGWGCVEDEVGADIGGSGGSKTPCPQPGLNTPAVPNPFRLAPLTYWLPWLVSLALQTNKLTSSNSYSLSL